MTRLDDTRPQRVGLHAPRREEGAGHLLWRDGERCNVRPNRRSLRRGCHVLQLGEPGVHSAPHIHEPFRVVGDEFVVRFQNHGRGRGRRNTAVQTTKEQAPVLEISLGE